MREFRFRFCVATLLSTLGCVHCLLRARAEFIIITTTYYCLPLNAGCDRDDDLCQRASFLENGISCCCPLRCPLTDTAYISTPDWNRAGAFRA